MTMNLFKTKMHFISTFLAPAGPWVPGVPRSGEAAEVTRHQQVEASGSSRSMWTYLACSLVAILSILALALHLGLTYRIFRLRSDISVFNRSLAVCLAAAGW